MRSDQTVSHASVVVPVRALRAEVTEGPDQGTVRSASDRITIGTDPSNDLVLTDDTVSRFHLDLVREGERIVARDHASTNGTLFNGVALERARIPPGTTLRLGKTAIRVLDGETLGVELFEGERFGSLIGGSPVMRQLMARLERAAASQTSVLVLGETGTGKEVVASALHSASARASGPFETVDCGSMLPTLIASELFGHERGAFTGADEQRIGAFERANGGTLFLDEIGELPANLQTMLLGALERRSIRRLGGKETIPIDVRVVCATNRDLRSEVNGGTFRQDLYFRVAVITLRLPPLRERAEDIPLLAAHFLREAGHTGTLAELLPPEALEAFAKHRWPGNVRELRNVIEAAVVMGEAPLLNEGADSPAAGARSADGSEDANDPDVIALEPLTGMPYNQARARLLDAFEEHYVRSILEGTRGNVSLAARRSGMDRSHLTRLVRKWGLRARDG